jgi:hypothetical protein
VVISEFWKMLLLVDKVANDLKSQFRRHKKRGKRRRIRKKKMGKELSTRRSTWCWELRYLEHEFS